MKNRLFALPIVGFLLVQSLAAGCASSVSAGSYPRSSARTSFDVRYGEVVSTRVVEIEGEATLLGRLGGAWIGYSLGMGEGSVFTGARRVRSSFGGVAGTVAGEAIERRIKTEDGLEIVVRLDQDETIAVVQAMDIEIRPGDRVQVVFGRDGGTRVEPL